MYSIIRVKKDGLSANTLASGTTRDATEKIAQRNLASCDDPAMYADDIFILLNHDNAFGSVVAVGSAIPPDCPLPQLKWRSGF